MTTCLPAGFSVSFAGDLRQSSVRSVRVCDLIADEVGELLSVGCRELQCEPAEAFGAQPDSKAAVDEGSDGE